jgi:hypothetical protein
MVNLLTQPYPLASARLRLRTAILVAVFVYVLLALFQPFHLNLLASNNRDFIIAGYGFICLLQLLVYYVWLPVVLKNIFDEDDWRIYKEIIWLSGILICIGASVAVYEHLVGTRALQLYTLAESVGKVFVIGIIPVTAITMLNRYRLLKQHLAEALEIHDRILSKETVSKQEPATQRVVLTSNNQGEQFEGALSDLMFIAALGNYVEVHFLSDGLPQRSLLRNTLSAVEQQLSGYPQMFRCHRAFLINLSNVSDANGNASGYELSFFPSKTKVPVAKRKTAEFRALMNGL